MAITEEENITLNFRIHPFGFEESLWSSISSFGNIFGHLCGDSHWQHHDPTCGVSWLLPSHLYVFLSWPLFLPGLVTPLQLNQWCWGHCYQLMCLFPSQVVFVIFSFLVVFFFPCPDGHRILLPGCHVLWLLHKHL